MHDVEDSKRIAEQVIVYKEAIAETILEVDPEGLDPVVAVYIAADMMGSAIGALMDGELFDSEEAAIAHMHTMVVQSLEAHKQKRGSSYETH